MRHERLYDIHEAAALFDVSSRTLWKYIKQGMITPTEVRPPKKQVFFSWKDIDTQKLIGLDEICARLRVNPNTMRSLLKKGLLNPFRIGLGLTKLAWFREAQLPAIKKVVESEISPESAAIQLVQSAGSVADALAVLELPSGQYGKWQVLGLVHGAGRQKVWCRCECGRKIQVDVGNLKSGRTRSCLQCQKPKREKREVYRAGTKFGKWKIVSYEGKQSQRPMYMCRCDCGTKRLVDGDMLKAGRTKSCGHCARKIQMELARSIAELMRRAGGRQQAIAAVQQLAKQRKRRS